MNYSKLRNLDFFNKQDFFLLSKWALKYYDKNNRNHVSTKNELLDSVWKKTAFWAFKVTEQLDDFETYNSRIWSQKGWEIRNGKNVRIVRFKEYTWARIFKIGDYDKHIFFTVGVNSKKKSLVYKLDYYKEQNSNLNIKQKEYCENNIPSNIKWIEIPFKKIQNYNWDKLIRTTKDFILKYEYVYDNLIKNISEKKKKANQLKNYLINKEYPEEGLETLPQRRGNNQIGATDWDKMDKKKKEIGKAGEDLVIAYEKNKLNNIGFANLAKKVKKVKDGKGFDIISFFDDSKVKYIEVKTTTGGAKKPFKITLNELEFSRKKSKSYSLYRLYKFDKKNNTAEYYEYRGNLDTYFLFEGVLFNSYRKQINKNE